MLARVYSSYSSSGAGSREPRKQRNSRWPQCRYVPRIVFSPKTGVFVHELHAATSHAHLRHDYSRDQGTMKARYSCMRERYPVLARKSSILSNKADLYIHIIRHNTSLKKGRYPCAPPCSSLRYLQHGSYVYPTIQHCILYDSVDPFRSSLMMPLIDASPVKSHFPRF